jgi:hypothetical protein
MCTGIGVIGPLACPLPATTVQAASVQESFNDVPQGHWAYQAVTALAKDGLIKGYGDGTFRGDQPLSRYEFALLTTKALNKYETASANDQAVIDKLTAEFAPELNRLGARLAKVEKKTNSWISGETRLRAIADNPSTPNGHKLSGADQFDFRQRIIIKGDINDKTSLYARLVAQGTLRGRNPSSSSSGSDTTVALDMANITAKDVLGLSRIRLGRSALDPITFGLLSKADSADGLLAEKKIGKSTITAYTGNVKWTDRKFEDSNVTYSDAHQITTGQWTYRPSSKWTLKTGYYWADIPGTSTPTGMGTLNTNVGSFDSSRGYTLGVGYKFGGLTLFGDYVGTTLNNVKDLPAHPKGWAVELTNSKQPMVFYYAVDLVDPSKEHTDAWMISYRDVEAGTIPDYCGGFSTMGVAYPAQPYSIFMHATDNVKAWFVAYQSVLAKNCVLALEYQNFRFKDKSLTGASSNKMDETYKAQMTFYY